MTSSINEGGGGSRHAPKLADQQYRFFTIMYFQATFNLLKYRFLQTAEEGLKKFQKIMNVINGSRPRPRPAAWSCFRILPRLQGSAKPQNRRKVICGNHATSVRFLIRGIALHCIVGPAPDDIIILFVVVELRLRFLRRRRCRHLSFFFPSAPTEMALKKERTRERESE